MREHNMIKALISAVCIASAAIAAAAASACDPYSPNLGDSPFRCGTDEPRCPSGYECVEYSATRQICEKSGPTDHPDARPGQSDGGPFECGADAELEPNDSITDPTNTPIPEFGDDYELIGLQICPDTDVDVFRFGVEVTGKNAIVTVTYRSADGELALSILNSSGVAIQAGAPTTNPDIINASVQNLPAGTYYAQVTAKDSGVENNYDISFALTD